MHPVASLSLAKFPPIEICAGSAEQTTLVDNSIDLIVIGNAFHRFKPEACSELRRILKKSGWIALFSYTFKNQEFSHMLFSKLTTLKEMAGRMDKTWHRTPVEDLFGGCQLHKWDFPQSHTEDWTAFFGSACSGIEAPEVADREFSIFEEINREAFDSFAVDGKITIEYETHVLFGQPLCL